MNVHILGDDVDYGFDFNFIKSRMKNTLPAKLIRARTSNQFSTPAPLGFGSSSHTIFRKQALLMQPYLGGDDLMGGGWADLGKGLLNIGKSVVKAVSSDTGKAVISAGISSVADRLTPTQKAQIASAQEAAGIPAQTLTTGGNTTINLPSNMSGGQSSMDKYLPYIIGGGGLLIIALIALKK